MDINDLTVDQIHGYLVSRVSLMPLVYERYLDEVVRLKNENKLSLLPLTIFEVYHLRLKRRITERIAQCKHHTTKAA